MILNRKLSCLIITTIMIVGAIPLIIPHKAESAHSVTIDQVIDDHTIDKVDVTISGEQYAIVTLDCYINPETGSPDSNPPQPPLKSYKVYIDSEGNPISSTYTLLKIDIIEKARKFQENKIVSAAQDMQELMVERLRIHGFIRLCNMLLDALSKVIATSIMVYMTGGSESLVNLKHIVAEAKDFICSIISDPINIPMLVVIKDFNDATAEYNEFVQMDRVGPITDYDVAYKYLRHYHMGRALQGPAQWAIDEFDDIDATFWEGAILFARGITNSILSSFKSILGFDWEDLQRAVDYVAASPVYLEYTAKRIAAQANVDNQFQPQLNVYDEYTLDLASCVKRQPLIPDLTVTYVGHSPSSVETGNSITVTYTIENKGNTPSGPFANRVFLSIPPYKWHTDIPLGTFYMDSMPAGSSQQCIVEVPVIQDVPTGSCYVTVYTDAFQTIIEAEDLGLTYPNNIGSTYPQMLSVISPPKIDLIIKSVNVPPSAEFEEVIPVSFTVENLGINPSGPFTNRVFLATSFIGTEIGVGEFPMSSLGGGTSRTTTVDIAIPSVLLSNQYYINVFTDGLDTIDETNEDNNIGSTYPNRIAIKDHPSPLIAYNPSQITFPSSIEGGYNPPNQLLKIWNSADGDLQWSVSDNAAWLNLWPTTGTYVGTANTVSVSADISGLNPGTYTATITISATDTISQIVPVTLTINPVSYPDLYISNLAVDDTSPYTGQLINTMTTVSNQGSSISMNTYLRYYFSTDGVTREMYLGQSTIGPVQVGMPIMVAKSVTIPNIACNQAYIIAVVNPTNAITEVNMNNNDAHIPLVIRELDVDPPMINYLRLQWGQGPENNDFKTGYEYTIVYSVTDNVQVATLDLYYSIDNRLNWNPIVTNFVPGSNGLSGGYRWTIPTETPLSNEANIKMIARDTSNNEVSYVSSSFHIIDGSRPHINILSPQGGEVWNLGSQHEIQWNASSPNGILSIRIYFHYADKVDFITQETVNDGTYTWTLPTSSNFVTNTGKIRIRISDGNANEAEGWNDGYFSINDPSLPPPAPWAIPECITTVPSGGPTSKNHFSPQITIDSNGIVHMVYMYTQDSGGATTPRIITQQILYKTYDGSCWSNPETAYSLTQETDGNLRGYHGIGNLQIAIDNFNNPHIVWQDSIGPHLYNYNFDEIYYCYRNNSSWSTPLNISSNSKIADFTWTTKSSLPTAKSYAACAVTANKIYVMGGNYHLSNYQYDPSSNVWTRKADLPNPGIDEGGAAVVNGKIYAIGGSVGNKVMIYSPSSDTWSTGATIPTARRGVGVAAVDDKIYIIGGCDASLNPYNVVERYDPVTDSWSTMANMPTSRGFSSVAVVNGLIYVIGGAVSGGKTNVVEVYDPFSDSWTERCPMPTRRQGAAIGVINNKIYVAGGFDGYNYLNSVEVYYPSRDIWAYLNRMSIPRSNSVGAVVDNKLYIIGGTTEAGTLDVVEEGVLHGVTDEDPTVSAQPRIAIDTLNNFHIVWCDGFSFNSNWSQNGIANLYYKNKNLATGEWSLTEILTEDGANRPGITADGEGNLHLVFSSGGGEIYYMSWNGVDWLPSTIAIGGNNNYLFDIIADANNKLHLTWYNLYIDEHSNTWQRILYCYYNGICWSDPEEASERIPGHYPCYPSVVADSFDRPHIIWEDNADGSVIYKRKSSLGFGWSDGIKLNLNSQYAGDASSSMAISSNDVLFVVWTNQYDGHSEIFFNHADVSQDVTQPQVTLTSPIGGESLLTDVSYNITWISIDDFSTHTVSLYYTLDNGSNYNEIVGDIIDTGIFEWSVPDIISDHVQIRIDVSDTSGNIGTYTSDYFSIYDGTKPVVNLISPIGGEVWPVESQHDIIWEATDNTLVKTIHLLYSINEGISWSAIALNITNLGFYSWIIPDKPASSYIIKVVAIDEHGNQGETSSTTPFSVTSANNPPNTPSSPTPDDEDINISINTGLSWTGGDLDSWDAVTYDVYFGNTTQLLLVSANQTDTTFDPGTFDYHTLYLWKVVATDNHGSSVNSSIWSFWTEWEPIPDNPSELTADTVSDTQINLYWIDNSDNELGFKIERKLEVSDSYTQLCTVEANTTSFSDTNLVSGINYYYRICSIGVSGNSSYTNECKVSPWIKPVALFTLYTESLMIGQVGHSIVFNASSSFDPDGEITTWHWDFNDGNTALGKITEHIYTSAGNYSINLTVTDNHGLTNIHTEDIIVDAVGDVNGDGTINNFDLIREERIIMGCDYPVPGADSNQDHEISSLDITKIEHITGLSSPSSVHTQITTITINAPNEILQGDTLIARIMIVNVTAFDACNFDVTFDNSILWLTGVTEGKIGETTIPVDMWSEITSGTVRIITNVPDMPAVNGSGYLAEIHFQVIGGEDTNTLIDLHDGVLSNTDAQAIYATWVDYTVHVNKLSDTPEVLIINQTGNGTVIKNPNQTTYTHGTLVTLTALPGTGWIFSHWSGSLTGSVNPGTINMTSNKTVTAHFIPLEYTFQPVVFNDGPNQHIDLYIDGQLVDSAYAISDSIVEFYVTLRVGYHDFKVKGHIVGINVSFDVMCSYPDQIIDLGKLLYIIKGDSNGDKRIDIFDFDLFAQAWSSTIGDERYQEIFDFDDDGDVDIFDFDCFAQIWGKTFF